MAWKIKGLAPRDNPLAEFIGDTDSFTARVLAATERACVIGAESDDTTDWLHEFCTWYRIAAVHERDRLAHAVRVLCDGGRVRMLDAAVTVMEYDARRCAQYPHLDDEVYDLQQFMYFQRELPYSYAYDTYRGFVPYPVWFRRPKRRVVGGREALRDEFDDAAVVRTTELFSALFHAVAEELLRRQRDTLFVPGEDFMVDAALADYIAAGGGLNSKPVPGNWYANVNDAAGDILARELGIRYAVRVRDELPGRARVLFGEWAPVLLDRTGGVFADYLAGRC